MPVLSSTSRETDEFGFWTSEKFKTEHGAEFAIEPQANGLYGIRQISGGNPAGVCGGLYTSHLRARDALIEFVKQGDKLGYAVYPGTDPAKQKISKKDREASVASKDQ